jgi:hypothetical protein
VRVSLCNAEVVIVEENTFSTAILDGREAGQIPACVLWLRLGEVMAIPVNQLSTFSGIHISTSGVFDTAIIRRLHVSDHVSLAQEITN